MKIEDILRHKGHDVVTVNGDETVIGAVRVLVEHDIGALVVVDGDRAVGIFTERDILRLTARSTSTSELESIRVGDAMTTDLITAKPDDALAFTMDVMTERKVRHLPIMDEGRLGGIVSIGDLLNACRVEAEQENTHLRQYIQGVG